MGICHFVVLFHISYVLVIFSVINFIITTIICYYSNVDMELVYNGLYPANTTFSTLYLYFFQIYGCINLLIFLVHGNKHETKACQGINIDTPIF